MSGIRTSITITDRMSAVFATMTTAIDACLESFERMDTAAAAGIDVAEIHNARTAIAAMNTEIAAAVGATIGLNRETSETEPLIRENTQEQEEHNEQIEQGESLIRENIRRQQEYNEQIAEGANAADGVLGKIKSMAAAYLGVQTAAKAIELSDTMVQTTARLDLMNDNLQTTEELTQMLYRSAQNSRAVFQTTADAVSKMGMQAADAFSSTSETVAFVELLNKQFKIAGTSAQGVDSVMLQLTQAMAAGKLQGEELNAVLDNAQPIVANIKNYLEEVQGIDASNIKKLASEGVLTADVLKNAMFYAADEINEQFDSIPSTWEDVANRIKNAAYMNFRPLLQTINDIANSERFESFANGAVGALSMVAEVAVGAMDMIVAAGAWAYDNWDLLGPIIMGVAIALGFYTTALGLSTVATKILEAAQSGLNATMLANPLPWILMLIVLVIWAINQVVTALNEVSDTTYSTTGVIMGAFAVAVAFLANLGYEIMDFVLGTISIVANYFIVFANFLVNVFENPISSIIYLFQDMADKVLKILESIAQAIDDVFGSNLAAAVGGWRIGLKATAVAAVGKYAPNENWEKRFEELNLSAGTLGFERFNYSDAYNAGYEWGKGIEDKFKTDPALGNDLNAFDYSALSDLAANTADNTKKTADSASKISDSMEITTEEIKYLRDIAEQEAINQFTTIPYSLTVQNTNHINSNMDIDEVCTAMTNRLYEEIEMGSEGVHK